MIFEINSNNHSLSYNKNKLNNKLIGSIHVKKLIFLQIRNFLIINVVYQINYFQKNKIINKYNYFRIK